MILSKPTQGVAGKGSMSKLDSGVGFTSANLQNLLKSTKFRSPLYKLIILHDIWDIKFSLLILQKKETLSVIQTF